MVCAIYICSSPSSTTTTAAPSTSRPSPRPISPAGYGSSVAINVIFAALLLAFCFKKLFKRREPFRPIIRARATRTGNSFENPSYGGQDPEENDPLVARFAFGRRASPSPNSFSLINLQAAEARLVNPDDPATFERSCPPPPYSSASNVACVESNLPVPSAPPLSYGTNPDVEVASQEVTSSRPKSFFDRLFRKKKPTSIDDIPDDELFSGSGALTDADL